MHLIKYILRVQYIEICIPEIYCVHNIANEFHISDLGFCGPADKPLDSIYGNLPYIAPEVVIKKKYTFASDIYSIGMLMWEISSGQPPFINYEHDYYLAMNIVNGIRPKIMPGTPLKYKSLMEKCWDADPSKRPDVYILYDVIQEINQGYYQNTSNENKNIIKKIFKNFNLLKLSQPKPNDLKTNKTNNLEIYYTSNKLSTSKVYQFEDYLPEPRNAAEGNITYHLFNVSLLLIILLLILFILSFF